MDTSRLIGSGAGLEPATPSSPKRLGLWTYCSVMRCHNRTKSMRQSRPGGSRVLAPSAAQPRSVTCCRTVTRGLSGRSHPGPGAAVIVLGIYGFRVFTRFETWNLSRRTTRTAQDVYPSYADSVRKQRRYARQHGGEWTSDDGGQSREPEHTQPQEHGKSASGPPAVRLSPLTRSTAAKAAAMAMAYYRRERTSLEHRPRRQPLLDKSGRFAHEYG